MKRALSDTTEGEYKGYSEGQRTIRLLLNLCHRSFRVCAQMGATISIDDGDEGKRGP
jgi:hypothetical protein